MSADDGVDPARPEEWTWTRMFWHVGQKGFQAGALIGGAVSPLFMYRSGNYTADVLTTTSGRGAVIGVVVAGVLGAARLRDQTDEQVQDRVYRLYYNEGQNRVDRFAQVGAAAGMAAGVLRAPSGGIWSVIGHAAAGAAAGVLAHGATAPKKVSMTAKEVKDLVDRV